MTKWVYTKVNDKFVMSRINGDAIEIRDLTWLEKIRLRAKCLKKGG